MHLANSPLSKSPFELPPELAFLEKGAPTPASMVGPVRKTSNESSEEDLPVKPSDDGLCRSHLPSDPSRPRV